MTEQQATQNTATTFDVSTKNQGKKEFMCEEEYKELIEYFNRQKKEDIEAKKSLKRFYEKYIKQLNRKYKSKKQDKKDNKHTGISAECDVPEQFKQLFNLEKDSKIPRTTIAKLLHKYLQDNHLKLDTNKQIFRVDDKLQKIFGLTKEQVDYINSTTQTKPTRKQFENEDDYNREMEQFNKGFNFFNFQTYLKIVYGDKDVSTSAPEPVVVVEAVKEMETDKKSKKASKKV
jgi:hypothetical protein